MDCKICKSCDKYTNHKWRFRCVSCRCPNYRHVSHVDSLDSGSSTGQHCVNNWIDSLTMESHNQLQDYKAAISMAESNNLVWLPIGLQQAEISDFLRVWNDFGPGFSLENIPINQLDRKMNIFYQIPDCDRISSEVQNHFDDKDEDKLIVQLARAFKKSRDTNYLGFGEIEPVDNQEVCSICDKQFEDEDIFCIRITHSAEFASHISCFECKTCKEKLVDFHYCWSNDSKAIFCLRHFGELTYCRCAECDEDAPKHFTKAMDQEFHVEHFACHVCDSSLTGTKYILRDDNPFCVKCFENQFGNTCHKCSEKISCDSKDLSFKEWHWHEKCFLCDLCHDSLVDRSFTTKDNYLYCPNCFDEKFSSCCDGCGKIFRTGVKKYEYAGKQWHEDCFICADCNQSIGTKSFIPINGKISCIGCYENKHAQKCFKCSEIIRKSGITYKGDPWHKECFLCTSCQKMLSESKFTSKEEKPYCTECFIELFCKRCKKCTQPISGFGGCKFISVGDDHWHTECFNCSKCQASMVGKGFFLQEDQMVCGSCGGARNDDGNENSTE